MRCAENIGLRAANVLCVAFPIMLAGCAVGPDFVRPQAPAVERYTHAPGPIATLNAGGQTQRFEPGAAIAADWWQLFKSAQLDAMVKQAIANNPNLQAAQASLRRSQAELQAGSGVFYPQLDAGFGATRQKYSPLRVGANAPASIFNLYTLAASVSYALDIFGGERRAVESLQAQVDLQRYTLAGTYLALSGNVVNAAIARAAYRAEIEATEQLIEQQKEQVSIAEAQAEAGTVPYSNLLALQSQLAAFEATLPPLKQRLAQVEHLLATLAGNTPAEWAPPQLGLADIALPGELPITLPSELVRQRPDILAAEAALHSSSAEIGVARAALFPSFTLNGAYGQNSTALHELFDSKGNYWNAGADVSAPLFHGGTLSAKQQAAVEAYQQSLANYRQTVLSAFAQVADALRALENDAQALQALAHELSSAEEALQLVQANYQAGIANYLQVLVANEQYHQAQIGYLQAKAQRLQDTVALFVALGGGWWYAADKNLAAGTNLKEP